jgi:mono/diheme cytochrome c family protein
MKTLLKIVGGLIGLIILIVVAVIIYLNSAFPKVYPAEDITIEATPERLARGAYLVNHVSICLDCHSQVKENLFSMPVKQGTEGMGGRAFEEDEMVVHVRNITPAGLKDWSDGQIVRAITEGIDKDGKALAPMMPYTEYKFMAKEDIHAVVAYLRTLPPIENDVPATELPFPMNLIFPTIPDSATPMSLPDTNDALATGKYMVRIAGCQFCHTPFEDGESDESKPFSGGHEFADPKFGIARSANITPDMDTGIGSWTKDMFIARFKSYADSVGRNIPVGGNVYQTAMPWTLLAGITEKDLGSIYDYLRTVKPITHKVEKFSPIEK